MNYFLLLLFGMLVGALSGMLGIGGGVALVPGLMLLFGFSQVEAQGTSLAVMIPPIGLFAAIVYYQHGYIRLPVVGWVALGFVVGAYVGARFVTLIPPAVLRVGFGVILLYVGFLFIASPRDSRPGAVLPAALGTLVATVVARLLRRSLKARGPAPPRPGDGIDYHI